MDELNRASIATLNALMRVVLDRQVGAKPLPADVFIVAACNPPGGSYQTTPLSTPMLRRWAVYWVHAEVQGWLAWATRVNVHPAVRAFIRQFPDRLSGEKEETARNLEAFPTPASWERLSHTLNGTNDPDVLPRRWALAAASVGVDVGHEFLAFWDSLGKIPDPEDVYNGKVPIPDRIDHAVAAVMSVMSWLAARATDQRTAAPLYTRLLQLQVEQAWRREVVALSAFLMRETAGGEVAMRAFADSPAWMERYGKGLVDMSNALREV
jgi:hypothetical protein